MDSKNPKGDVYHLTGDLNLSHVGALRLEVPLDESLPSGGRARCNGNFVLTGIETKFIFDDQEKSPFLSNGIVPRQIIPNPNGQLKIFLKMPST